MAAAENYVFDPASKTFVPAQGTATGLASSNPLRELSGSGKLAAASGGVGTPVAVPGGCTAISLYNDSNVTATFDFGNGTVTPTDNSHPLASCERIDVPLPSGATHWNVFGAGGAVSVRWSGLK